MKRTHFVIAMLAIMFVIGGSCKKEESQEINTEGKSTGTFTAVIDGAFWQAAPGKQTASILDKMINLKGIGGDRKMINITIAGDTAGTYYVSKAGKNGVIVYTPGYGNPGVNYVTDGAADTTLAYGKVIIADIDTVKGMITGTFEGIGFKSADSTTKTISLGSFNLTYITDKKPAGPGNPTGPTNPGNPGTSIPAGSFKATIGGKAWSAKLGNGVPNGTASSGIVGFSGADMSFKSITLTMPVDVAVGNYAIDGTTYSATYAEVVNLSNAKTYEGKSGTLTIVSNDKTKKTISGTFSFEGKEDGGGTISVTNGSFNLTYQ